MSFIFARLEWLVVLKPTTLWELNKVHDSNTMSIMSLAKSNSIISHGNPFLHLLTFCSLTKPLPSVYTSLFYSSSAYVAFKNLFPTGGPTVFPRK